MTHVLRNDGVVEHFATQQHRAVLERISAMTGGRYWTLDELDGLAAAIPYSKAGMVERQTLDLWNLPTVFLLLLALKLGEWLLQAGGGEGCETRAPVSATICDARQPCPPLRWCRTLTRRATYTFIVAGLGGEAATSSGFASRQRGARSGAEGGRAAAHVDVLTGEKARREPCAANCKKFAGGQARTA